MHKFRDTTSPGFPAGEGTDIDAKQSGAGSLGELGSFAGCGEVGGGHGVAFGILIFFISFALQFLAILSDKYPRMLSLEIALASC